MRGTLLAALVCGTALAGCGDGQGRIVVGAKNFTEQNILAELLAQQIEEHTPLQVERRFHLGGTFVCHQALRAGEIDLYVEYTGTAYTAILGHEPISDPDSVYATVKREYAERFDLVWGAPLGFDNTFAIVIRRADAESLGVQTISQAATHATDWTPGFGYEFMERQDGFTGLKETYGLDFDGTPKTMELGLTYRALAEGRVDLIAGNSTDGQIAALDLVALEDDRHYFPPYEAAPVMRSELGDRHPALRDAIRALEGTISNREMRHLNYLVDVEHRDLTTVVREWLAGQSAPNERLPSS